MRAHVNACLGAAESGQRKRKKIKKPSATTQTKTDQKFSAKSICVGNQCNENTITVVANNVMAITEIRHSFAGALASEVTTRSVRPNKTKLTGPPPPAFAR